MDISHEVVRLQRANEETTWSLSERIWGYAETGLLEERSAAAYREVLRENGFEVSEVEGMPTAFIGTWGSGRPVIGFTGEYDALPALSQKAGVTHCEPEGENRPGHGCGHNNLGTGALGAALVVRDYMEENGLSGTVKFFGTPSEERDACKTYMARDGYFEDLDFAITWHPKDRSAVWTAGTLANVIAIYHFKGVAAHAANSPEMGRSALDSAELMNVGVNYLREHVVEQARMHYAYTDVGGRAPNVVQPSASVYYFLRAPKIAQALDIYERVNNIARGAALMCGTQVEIQFVLALSDYLCSHRLAKVMQEAMEELGAPEYDEEDYRLAKEFYETLTDAEKNAARDRLSYEFSKEEIEHMERVGLQDRIEPLDFRRPVQTISSDVGDLSYSTPTIQVNMATAALGTNLHTWQMTAQGLTSYAKKSTARAIQVMALTAIKALLDPAIIEEAQQELIAARGPKYVCPLPKEVGLRDPKVQP
ncbi:MAG: amidohydrolase [Ndongobacter sp.]|nr:amidohydrolase [Ndongobacter sp.]